MFNSLQIDKHPIKSVNLFKTGSEWSTICTIVLFKYLLHSFQIEGRDYLRGPVILPYSTCAISGRFSNFEFSLFRSKALDWTLDGVKTTEISAVKVTFDTLWLNVKSGCDD